MMSRTQISLDQESLKKARKRASQLGVSLAEFIRRLLARELQESRSPVDPSSIFDLGSSGGSDIAREKDAAIGAAAAAERAMPSRNRRRITRGLP